MRSGQALAHFEVLVSMAHCHFQNGRCVLCDLNEVK